MCYPASPAGAPSAQPVSQYTQTQLASRTPGVSKDACPGGGGTYGGGGEGGEGGGGDGGGNVMRRRVFFFASVWLPCDTTMQINAKKVKKLRYMVPLIGCQMAVYI